MMKKLVILMVMISSFFTTNASSLEMLRLNMFGEPDTLDPRMSNNFNAFLILSMTNEGLSVLDEEGKAVLGIAERVEKSDDGKTYTFHLRKTKWSDGVDLTAEDFVYSWRSVLNPDMPAPCVHLLHPLKNAEKIASRELPVEKLGVKALDANTLVVELERPVPFFLELIATKVFIPVPKHAVEACGKGKWGSSEKIVTNGAFQMASWDHGHGVVVKKNPHYWDAASTQLDQIDISIVEDPTSSMRLYQQGKIDFVGGSFSSIPRDALEGLKKKGTLRTMSYWGTRYCALNVHTFPFNNRSLRKAFSIATHRQELIDHVTRLDDLVACNVIAPVLMGTAGKRLFPDGDKELAKRYLKEALDELKMKPEELKITLKYEEGEMTKQMALVLQQQWKDVLGIDVTLEQMELKTLVSSLRKRDFQMGLIYWIPHYNSPVDVLERYRSKDLVKNYPAWQSKEYAEMLDLYFATGKEELLLAAEKVFIDDMPVIPLCHSKTPYLVNSSLRGFYSTPVGESNFTKAYWDKTPKKKQVKKKK